MISAYTAGADGVMLVVHLSKDGRVVCCPSDDLAPLTGQPGRVSSSTAAELRLAEIGATFSDRHGKPVRHRARATLLSVLLEDLPSQLDIVIDLTQADQAAKPQLIERAAAAIAGGPRFRSILFVVRQTEDVAALRAATPRAAIAMTGADPEQALADGIRLGLDAIVVDKAGLTRVEPAIRSGSLALGAIVVPDGGLLDPAQLKELAARPGMHAALTRSVLACQQALLPYRTLCDETFRGRDIDTDNWAFGYARANRYCHVYQDDGVHIDILPFEPAARPPAPDDVERRLRRLEAQVLQALEETPYYSGGGAGLRRGIVGDFISEAKVSSAQATQASTLEIAVVNGDPGRHIEPWKPDGTPRLPQGHHDKHSFYDPHGARPYAGCEHDENDGYRINWNASTVYDDNHYGPALGDGLLLDAWLRLERRGSFFSAYFRRPDLENDLDWICVGAVRNDALARQVYLRCAGKRWRKADPNGGYFPIVPNHFVFHRIRVLVSGADASEDA
ncbi:MAG: hypothetical protein K2Y27_29280 [Xanthobacteraceae bacterium]|nr:hypothetical protein [Xanthobacteraceae bacterium]